MPRVLYSGPAPAHAPSLPGFLPGETRDVSDETAERLLRNVHFSVVQPDPEPVKEAAGEQPAKKSKTALPSEGPE